MSGNKKKRHIMELIGAICVVAVLGGGLFWLKIRQDGQRTEKTASESDEVRENGATDQMAEETTGDSLDGSSADTDVQSVPEAESEAPDGTDPQEATVTPTPAPEERTAGRYQAVSWAQAVGDEILVCQTDAIEVRDSSNNVVKNYTDLGRISRESAAVYSNGQFACFASADESGTENVWRLDLETGEKEPLMTLESGSRFVGANQEYLYYTAWGGDGMENTLKAHRISDGAELELGKNVDEVTVLPDYVITMGLRFDVSPTELRVCGPDGSSSQVIGEYVNSYVVENDRIYYLDYGSDYGYLPSDLKSCGMGGEDVQVLAEDLNALSFCLAGEHTVYFAGSSEGADSSGDGYIFYNYRTGERKKAADSGTYIQFLCENDGKAYLERENQIVVYDIAEGRFLDSTYQVPDGSYAVEGFWLNGMFWAVQQTSDHRVDVIPLKNF